MKVKYFNSVRYPWDWELNFIGSKYNLRIGRSQVAVWHNNVPMWQWLSTAGRA